MLLQLLYCLLEMSNTSLEYSKVKEIFGNNASHIDSNDREEDNDTSDILILDNHIDVDDNNEEFPGFSSNERKVLINKIIEKRKRGRRGLSTTNNEDSEEYYQPDSDHHDTYDTAPHANDLASVSTIAGEQEISMVNEQKFWQRMNNNNDNSNLNDSRNNQNKFSRQRSKSLSYISVNNNNTNRNRSVTPTSRRKSSDAHNNTHNTSINLSTDFTFKPIIKPLPSSYGKNKIDDSPFYDRISKWQRDKAGDNYRRQIEKRDDILSDCTFQPRININSQRAVQEIRNNKNSINISYSRSHDTNDDINSSIGVGRSGVGSVAMSTHGLVDDPHERLYRQNQYLLEQKLMMLERELERERREESVECTFQPNLVTNQSRYTEVRPKYNRDASAMREFQQYQAVQESMPKDCTFQPNVSILPRTTTLRIYIHPITHPPLPRSLLPYTLDTRP